MHPILFSTLRAALLLLVATGASACVTFSLRRELVLEPVAEKQLAQLAPGDANLQSALDVLGPPLLAWELPQQETALAWGWSRTSGWALMGSVPIADQGGSLSLDYASEGSKLQGVVLMFDRDWRLISIHQGRLRALIDSSRVRPETPTDG
jgi:hypothetical protein